MDLGEELGLSKGTLRKFKDPSGHSPSQAIIEKIKEKNSTLSITRIQEVLSELQLEGVASKLTHLRGISYFTFMKTTPLTQGSKYGPT